MANSSKTARGLMVSLFGLLCWAAPEVGWPQSPARTGPAAHAVSRSMSEADQTSLRTALEAYDHGDLAHAEPLLQVLAQKYPRSYESHEALGSLYVEKGEVDHALPLLEQACRLAPREAIAHANLGAAFLKLGRASDASAQLRVAAQLEPSNGSTQGMLGQALMSQGQPAKAAEAFAAASSAQPADWGLRYNLALALFDGGLFKRAEEALSAIPDAAATDQTKALAAEVHEKLGDYKQALLDYQAAAQLNPSDENLFALTAELLRHWTWGQAIEIARYGAQHYPSSLHFKMAEGIGLYADSQFPLAASVFASMLNADPDNAVYADLLGRSCSLVADGASADCEGLEAFATRHPENAQAAAYAAAAILHRPAEQQDIAKAESLLKQALAADAKLADAHFQMGVLYQMRQDWKQSAASLEQAVALRPAFPEAHYRLSRAYAHLGQREQAQREIALQQQYSKQEKDNLNSRMQEVVKFVVKPS